MRLNEITDTDPVLKQWLLKLHKGAVGGFNAKTTQAVLGLFNGWTMTPELFIKPSDELGYNDAGFRGLTSIKFEEYSETFKQMMPHSFSLNGHAMRPDTRLHVESYSEKEAKALRANVAKYLVAKLPDPKKAKPDDFFVMNLAEPKPEKDEEGHTRWMWAFDLYRKCKGYRIIAPNGKHFDVCGPTQVLGYGGTKDFAAFFKWAMTETDLEAAVNAKLGMTKHIPASERPRVPVGGQSIGTCAICMNEQVVRDDHMVLHGYQRPGHGYVVGNCFGVGYAPYEASAEACAAYIPVLQGFKESYQQRLNDLQSGKISQFVQTRHNYRTGQDEQIVIKKGDPKFAGMLKNNITETERQITYVERDIAEMQRRIKDWKAGTVRHREGLPTQ